MQRWIYYPDMGRINPVCEDAGKITRVNVNEAPDDYFLRNIVADGIVFSCENKQIILELGRIFSFLPTAEDMIDKKQPNRILPDGIKYGVQLEVSPYFRWEDKEGRTLTPICIDPRVLYIAHRSWELIDREKEPTEDEVRRWREDIPTVAQAREWLERHGKKTDCIPWGCMEQIIKERGL